MIRNRTRSFAIAAALLAGCAVLTACNHEQQRPVPPSSKDIGTAVTELYRVAGVATDIGKQEILGKHYRPAEQSWDVLACVEFTLPGQDNGRDCNDSFELYRLDSGKWVISGTVNGIYRWLEVLQSP